MTKKTPPEQPSNPSEPSWAQPARYDVAEFSAGAWIQAAAEEAHSLKTLLESDDVKVMVMVVAAHSDAKGTTDVVYSVSEGTKKTHAIQFRAAVLARAEFLLGKINRTGAKK
jgi:hypothetical protein